MRNRHRHCDSEGPFVTSERELGECQAKEFATLRGKIGWLSKNPTAMDTQAYTKICQIFEYLTDYETKGNLTVDMSRSNLTLKISKFDKDDTQVAITLVMNVGTPAQNIVRSSIFK